MYPKQPRQQQPRPAAHGQPLCKAARPKHSLAKLTQPNALHPPLITAMAGHSALPVSYRHPLNESWNDIQLLAFFVKCLSCWLLGGRQSIGTSAQKPPTADSAQPCCPMRRWRWRRCCTRLSWPLLPTCRCWIRRCCRMARGCSRMCRWQAWTMRCGFTGPSVPMTGCSTAWTARRRMVPAALPAG